MTFTNISRRMTAVTSRSHGNLHTLNKPAPNQITTNPQQASQPDPALTKQPQAAQARSKQTKSRCGAIKIHSNHVKEQLQLPADCSQHQPTRPNQPKSFKPFRPFVFVGPAGPIRPFGRFNYVGAIGPFASIGAVVQHDPFENQNDLTL